MTTGVCPFRRFPDTGRSNKQSSRQPRHWGPPSTLCEIVSFPHVRYSMRRINARRLLALLCLAGTVVGCQSPPPPQVAVKRPEFMPPAEGEAFMYLFRPKVDKVRRSESPTLLIDEKAIGRLHADAYVRVSLKAGKHHAELKPSWAESDVWRVEGDFAVEPGRSYFIAVWNVDQPGVSTYRNPGVGGPFIFVDLFMELRSTSRNQAKPRVQLESVTPEIADDALNGLELTEPQNDHLPPLP